MATQKNTKSIPAEQAKEIIALPIVESLKKNEARYELQTALTPLFQPVNDGAKQRQPRTVRREFKTGWIEYHCPEELSIFDESVVLALLRIATNAGPCFLLDSSNSTVGTQLKKIFDPDKSLSGHVAGVIQDTSYHEIAKQLGLKRPSHKDYKNIRASVARLANTTITQRDEFMGCETHGESGFFRHQTQENGRLTVVFIRRLAAAAFGGEGWRFAVLNLDERNSLKGDIAKSAHKFLVSWMWWDGCRSIRLDTLAGHVWAQWSSYSTSGKTVLRVRLKAALAQINGLAGWGLTTSGRGTAATVSVGRRDGLQPKKTKKRGTGK